MSSHNPSLATQTPSVGAFRIGAFQLAGAVAGFVGTSFVGAGILIGFQFVPFAIGVTGFGIGILAFGSGGGACDTNGVELKPGFEWFYFSASSLLGGLVGTVPLCWWLRMVTTWGVKEAAGG